ncbi:MAG: hypothetical protein H7175_14800, partial [Burkholderiales bacterium]|nr:hypothetical protein [Anaerolineae bacterium]
MRKRLRLQYAYLLEAALVGVFFVQALRFLIGTLYSHIASAGIVINIDPASVPAGTGGVVDPAAVTNEVTFVLIMIGLPLLTLLFGRWRWWLVVGAALVAIGRALMFGQTSLTPTLAAALAVGGGLLYISSLIRHRAQTLP